MFRFEDPIYLWLLLLVPVLALVALLAHRFRRKRKFTLTLFIKLLFLLLFCVFMNKQSLADPLVDVCKGKKEGHKFYDRSTNYVYVCKGGRGQVYSDTAAASCNADKVSETQQCVKAGRIERHRSFRRPVQ